MVTGSLIFISRFLIFISRSLIFYSQSLIFISRSLIFISRFLIFISRSLIFYTKVYFAHRILLAADKYKYFQNPITYIPIAKISISHDINIECHACTCLSVEFKPKFKPGLAKPGFISHEKSDLNHGLNHTKTRFDQTRFKPWFYSPKLRPRPDTKNWPTKF